jgi:hypothetical protein
MGTLIIFAVIIVAAIVVARMAFSAEGSGAPPPLPEEPSLSNPPHFVPRLQRQRSAPVIESPPSSILGLPTDGPPPRVREDDEWTMYQRLIERVGDRARADRMIEHERVSWPMMSRRDWIIRAEQKLDAQSPR